MGFFIPACMMADYVKAYINKEGDEEDEMVD